MVVRRSLRSALLLLALCVLIVVAPGKLQAQKSVASPLVSTQASSAAIDWQPLVSYAGASLRVTGPDGFVLERQVQADAPLEVSLADLGENAADGLYHYELVLAPVLSTRARATLEHQRTLHAAAAGEDAVASGLSRTVAGIFRVLNGTIQVPDASATEPQPKSAPQASMSTAGSGAMTAMPSPDQVIADDLIVQGSECVGFDCVNNESFGFDTLRLKENNTRIKFEDTSTSTGFPTTDWQLTANDSASGGASYFSIDDVTDGTTPFKVSANAPTGSIYVSSNGYVGFGTTTPVLQLQETRGDTPSLRLEQNGSSGFSPQTWDVAGNETNFFIRDVTHSSNLPFRIRPGAPTSSIDITSAGYVGIDTASATAPLDVVGKNGTGDNAIFDGGTLVVQRSDNTPAIRFLKTQGSTQSWLFQNNSSTGVFAIRDETGGKSPVQIYPGANGQLLQLEGDHINVNGAIYQRGGVLHADYVFEPSFKLESIADHAKYMWKHKHLPGIAGMKKDAEGREIVNLGAQQRGIVQELEEAHIYISQLNKELAQTRAQLKKERESTQSRLTQLQTQLAKLQEQVAHQK